MANANDPKATPPAPRPQPICPNCERSGGRHFPGCPLAPPRVLDISLAAVDGTIRRRFLVLGCKFCRGKGVIGGELCTACGGTGGH